MKYKNFATDSLVFLSGMIFSTLCFHLRFENEILRRELLIFMREGNGYFFNFFILEVFCFCFLLVLYGIINAYFNRRKNEKSNKSPEH